MKKVEIPISKGHAASSDNGLNSFSSGGSYITYMNIPTGYVWTRNICYAEDGTLGLPPYITNFGSTVGTSAIVGMFYSLYTTDNVNNFIYAVGSDGKVYFTKNGGTTWTKITFKGAGTEPTLSTTVPLTYCNFGTRYLIFKEYDVTKVTYIIDNTDTSGGNAAPSFTCIYESDTAYTKGMSVCNHENRILVGGYFSGTSGKNPFKSDDTTPVDPSGNWIRYSEINEPLLGWANNYVAVGDAKENIQYIFDGERGLIVIKDYSIWEKNSYDTDGISSYQFQPVKSAISRVMTANCFDGVIYVLNKNGLLSYSARGLIDLSPQVLGEWNFNNTFSLGYWRQKKWVMVCDYTSSIVWIYDLVNNRWFTESDYRKTFMTTNDGICIFTDDTNQPKRLNAGIRRDAQSLWTPFFDLGNPNSIKHAQRLVMDWNTVGTVRVRVYVRSGVGSTATTLYDSSVAGANVITNGAVYLDKTKEWKELSVHIECAAGGSNSFAVKSIGIEYEDFRE